MSLTTKEHLLRHCEQYPLLQVQDVFKFIHQSAFGCEHLVTDLAAVTDYIKKEADENRQAVSEIEPLDGDFCRVHLGCLADGIAPETLGQLFYLSAQKSENGTTAAQEKIKALLSLTEEQKVPFSVAEIQSFASGWQQNGFCALRHSESFRKAYAPAYRVIKKEYAFFLPLFAEIDRRLQHGSCTLAIDGKSGSGKSTLASLLEQVYGCTVFHTDDFFLQPQQRTPARLAEVGGNMDRERFLMEVLFPHSQGECVQYRRFDCSTFTLQPPEPKQSTPLTVIEGAYCMHPGLCHFYDFAVFMDISAEAQKQRILKRNGEVFAQRFFNEWIPMEEKYFTALHVKERCNMIIETE